MRQNIIKSILLAILLSVGISASAERVHIETTVKGSISSSINGSTVTLTVTPNEGYYITVDDISVEKAIDGSIAASRRADGPDVAEKLTVTAVNVDDRGKGTYIFTLVDDYGAYVTATFTECISITPTIAISNWTYGDTPSTPTVSGNTGNGIVTIKYALSTSTDYITSVPTNAGSYKVYAEIAAKGHYKSAKTQNVNFTIVKAPLKAIAKSYTIKQGEALPTFEATYEGFKNNETSEVLTKQPSITTTATSASEPGEYGITISGGEAQNYDISYVAGKLTIVDADALVVTAKSYTIKYGDELPKLEFTSEGATLNGTPDIKCDATKTSPVGTYPIVITKGSVTNYNDTYVNGTLTIEKAPLKAIAKSYTIKQGEALPTFEATYEGFKNNETSEVLTKQPSITTTATSASEPGEYDITISGGEAQNYDISYVAGKLTIEAVEITPITGTEETSFKEAISNESDLENTVIDNTYYNVNAGNGDGYNATEQALVLNTTTSSEQMTAIQSAQVGDASVRENYSGIIFEIPAGQGTITVDTKTVGTHVLNVQIGNGAPTQVQKSERGTADVSYNVSAPTYVYLYASTQGGSAARLYRAGTAGANSVLLYGYKVTIGGTGIEELKNVKMEDMKYFDLNGRKVNTPGKGVYIINGRKVVIK